MPDDSAATILATHPSLNTLQTDNTSADYYERFDIRDVIGRDAHNEAFIHERFKKRISKDTQASVLTLQSDYYYESAASRLATCCFFGTAYKEGKCKKHAKVHRHTCHIWICTYCGKPQNKMHCWARQRKAEILSTKQTGIEIFGPEGKLHSEMHALARKLTKALGSIHSVRYFVVDPNSNRSAIRVAAPLTNLQHSQALSVLRNIAGPEYSLQLKSNVAPLALLKWVFSATDAIWSMCGHSRAKVYMHYGSKHLLQSNGALYQVCKDRLARITKEDLFSEEIEQQASGHKDMCPCGCGEMVDIPPDQQRILPIDELEKRYLTIDYSGCYDPFHQAKKDSAIDETHSTKFEGSAMSAAKTGRHGPN